jgi:FdhD protein
LPELPVKRASGKIVQKAVVAGIPFIAAVGALFSLAVDLAERFDVTPVGFLKLDSMNAIRMPSGYQQLFN